MAVRRISDLPELTANYSNISLDDCLLEVSYTPKDHIYQSFSIKGKDFIANATGLNYVLPIATDTKLGGVKGGGNISIKSNDGTINTKEATSIASGVVKVPDADCLYVSYNKDTNSFKSADAPTATTSGITNNDIKAIWPVGSVYITVGRNDPPYPSILTWQRLAFGRCLWNVNPNDTDSSGKPLLGSNLYAVLPKLDGAVTVNSSGSHEHYIALKTRSGLFDDSAKTPSYAAVGGSLVDPTKPENFKKSNEKDGYYEYLALEKNGPYTYAQIKAMYNAGVFKSSKTVDEKYTTDPTFKNALDKIVPGGTKTKRFNAVNDIDDYIILRENNYNGLGHMSKSGEHTHAIKFNSSSGSVYAGTSNIVRPTSIGVVMWQRIR